MSHRMKVAGFVTAAMVRSLSRSRQGRPGRASAHRPRCSTLDRHDPHRRQTGALDRRDRRNGNSDGYMSRGFQVPQRPATLKSYPTTDVLRGYQAPRRAPSLSKTPTPRACQTHFVARPRALSPSSSPRRRIRRCSCSSPARRCFRAEDHADVPDTMEIVNVTVPDYYTT